MFSVPFGQSKGLRKKSNSLEDVLNLIKLLCSSGKFDVRVAISKGKELGRLMTESDSIFKVTFKKYIKLGEVIILNWLKCSLDGIFANNLVVDISIVGSLIDLSINIS